MNASWPSFCTAVTVVAVLFMPLGKRLGLKALCAVVFIVSGEAILLGGADGGILLNAAVFLSAGLLFLAEIAAVRPGPLVPLLWLGSGLVGTYVMVRQQDEFAEWLDAQRLPVAVAGAVASLIVGMSARRGRRRTPGFPSSAA